MIPALFDMTGTSLMYVGLSLTYASSFQMLRGAAIVFTGILSMGFLERRFGVREWSGIVFVITGLSLVGISDFIMKDDDSIDTNSILTGDLLIICAQVNIIKNNLLHKYVFFFFFLLFFFILLILPRKMLFE